MAGQAFGQQGSAARQPAGGGPLRHHELAGGVLETLPFQFAQDKDRAIFVRQPGQLLIEQPRQIDSEFAMSGGGFGHVGDLFFTHLPFGAGRPRLERGLMCHAIKPIADHLPGLNRGSLADQDQKGGLECIFGVVVVGERAPADAPNHGSMALH
jgi:hypothetical protein